MCKNPYIRSYEGLKFPIVSSTLTCQCPGRGYVAQGLRFSMHVRVIYQILQKHGNVESEEPYVVWPTGYPCYMYLLVTLSSVTVIARSIFAVVGCKYID